MIRSYFYAFIYNRLKIQQRIEVRDSVFRKGLGKEYRGSKVVKLISNHLVTDFENYPRSRATDQRAVFQADDIEIGMISQHPDTGKGRKPFPALSPSSTVRTVSPNPPSPLPHPNEPSHIATSSLFSVSGPPVP
jgi:hypothetical protein